MASGPLPVPAAGLSPGVAPMDVEPAPSLAPGPTAMETSEGSAPGPTPMDTSGSDDDNFLGCDDMREWLEAMDDPLLAKIKQNEARKKTNGRAAANSKRQAIRERRQEKSFEKRSEENHKSWFEDMYAGSSMDMATEAITLYLDFWRDDGKHFAVPDPNQKDVIGREVQLEPFDARYPGLISKRVLGEFVYSLLPDVEEDVEKGKVRELEGMSGGTVAITVEGVFRYILLKYRVFSRKQDPSLGPYFWSVMRTRRNKLTKAGVKWRSNVKTAVFIEDFRWMVTRRMYEEYFISMATILLSMDVLTPSEGGGMRAIAQSGLHGKNLHTLRFQRKNGLEWLQVVFKMPLDKAFNELAANAPLREVTLEWQSDVPNSPIPMHSAPCIIFLWLLLRNWFTTHRDDIVACMNSESDFDLILPIRDECMNLPLFPLLNHGPVAQGINYTTGANRKALAHRVGRALQELFDRIDKSSHHTNRKGFAKRFLWEAAVRNGGILPEGAVRQLCDIVGWSPHSVQLVWKAYIQACLRGIIPTNSIGDRVGGFRALPIALEDEDPVKFHSTLMALAELATGNDSIEEAELAKIMALWTWKKLIPEGRLRLHLSQNPHFMSFKKFYAWVCMRLPGHATLVYSCFLNGCDALPKGIEHGMLFDEAAHLMNRHHLDSTLQEWHCSECAKPYKSRGQLIEHVRLVHIRTICLMCGGAFCFKAFKEHQRNCLRLTDTERQRNRAIVEKCEQTKKKRALTD
eukprot:Phypoly_transcript_02558.p1 GENE.Phypoly_transcript_02558~~Phypoly_transcript_02558.p1  ORF type:complete len:743 (+),score=63.36 Phypoly_transcript_02558:363-2591(+)